MEAEIGPTGISGLQGIAKTAIFSPDSMLGMFRFRKLSVAAMVLMGIVLELYFFESGSCPNLTLLAALPIRAGKGTYFLSRKIITPT